MRCLGQADPSSLEDSNPLYCVGDGSPLYDLCILSIAVAFLIRNGMSRGFLPGSEREFFCVAVFSVAMPIVPIISAVLFFLCVRRTAAHRCDLLTERRLAGQ